MCLDPLYLVKVTALHLLFPFSNEKPLICYLDATVTCKVPLHTYNVAADILSRWWPESLASPDGKSLYTGLRRSMAQNQTSGPTGMKRFPVLACLCAGPILRWGLTHINKQPKWPGITRHTQKLVQDAVTSLYWIFTDATLLFIAWEEICV